MLRHLLDERDPTVIRTIEGARRAGRPIGLCDKAPSDDPELAQGLAASDRAHLVDPDAVLAALQVVSRAEGASRRGVTVTGRRPIESAPTA
jgi:hypothetical protein